MRYGDMSQDKYNRVRYRIARELLDAKSTDRVLDIGCYDGYFLYTLNADCYGYDNDSEAAKVAEERGIKILPSLNTPFKFDKIICMELLEHLKDPIAMIEQIKFLLVPGGKVIISVPNECNLWARIRMLLGWGINDLPFANWYHMHYPTLKQTNKLISKYFKIANKRYWVYGLPQWFRFLPNLFARGVIYECY